MGILKVLYIVNLHRVMSMLKFEIIVNLPQLLCVVVSAAQNREFARFHGLCHNCYYMLLERLVTVNIKTHHTAQLTLRLHRLPVQAIRFMASFD